MTTINAKSRLRIPDDVVFRDVIGEAMILHLGSGTYFGLDPVGTRIWQLIAEGRDIDAVCAAMGDEFDVPADQVRRDVLALARQLVDKRLLDIDA